ncbi:hypothetical protein [Sulfodiicoccus acidiphilus]|uniref:hypothetical protein n=1 Tax=Sulfodiicoccus acidiphilus TaxID=1670455 RepID=UPI0015D0A676
MRTEIGTAVVTSRPGRRSERRAGEAVTLHDLEGNRLILWLSYFQEGPRSRGRRIPRSSAHSKISLEDLVRAAQAFGLNPE